MMYGFYGSSFASSDYCHSCSPTYQREEDDRLQEITTEPPVSVVVKPIAVVAPPLVLNSEQAEKLYILCPFKDKDKARALGAKWDQEAKKWYATSPEIYAKLKKWHPPAMPKTVAFEVPPPSARLPSPTPFALPPPVTRMEAVHVKVRGQAGKTHEMRYAPYKSESRGERMVRMTQLMRSVSM